MCGICGQYNYKSSRPVDQETIKRMAASIVHRGPDDEGYYFNQSLGFGFRRLSIIDLSGGHQPMSDVDENIWIVFNGEIYNYPELRSELESYGHRFQTRSDTEVIIYGYKQWGDDVFNHLNGMFGVAIWDNIKKRLVISRDRMGIKLVYFHIDNETLTFGSEIRTVTARCTEKPEVDTESLYMFLRYRYTPSPYTIFKDIYKLAPGTCMVVENGEYKIHRWWNYKPEPFKSVPKIDDARDELLDLYRKSMKRHLLSDVPVGLLLSGGVDSALLLALMKESGESWDTFTVGYGKDYADDELSDAAETARILKSPNYQTNINKKIFEDNFSQIISYLEEPIASASIIPMFYVCQRARENVKVALVGQGPDELFGGYKRHLGVRYGAYWRNIPSALRYPVKSVINNLPRAETLKRGVYSLDIPDRMQRYQNVFSINSPDTIDGLFKKGLINENTGNKALECWNELSDLMENTDELGGLQFIEIRYSLPDELLMYADKLSMAHSLELRVPYLDKEIVEYVEKLPASYKIRWGNRKFIHKEVCKNYLPAEIINRKKRAFGTNVVDEWFQNSVDGKFNDYIMDPQSLMYKYLDYEAVKSLLDSHRTQQADNYKILFSIVVFEEWLRLYY